jgi:predicted AAA+ superfamily ATPase
VGKSTLVRQVLARLELPAVQVSADEPTLRDRVWIEQQWDAARLLARDSRRGAILSLDEVQKVTGWSETVKRLWDEDAARRVPLRVVLLGSAPLLIQRGLGESLAGRFEILHLPHWSFSEMREAFGWPLEKYLFFGGYPGAAPLAREPRRWARYVKDSLVETTISRDVLLLTRVDKPALLRQLFELACAYSGQELSYQKMLGQLQDAGNTTTLAHYLDLLGAAGMVTGLQKFAGDRARRRGSSPKLQVLNTALLTAQSGLDPLEARRDRDFRGRLVESAVGAHLANAAAAGGCELFYWRDGDREVDFVARAGRRVTAIEVKSGRRRGLAGLREFDAAFGPHRKLLVGEGGISLEEFLARPVEHWLRR